MSDDIVKGLLGPGAPQVLQQELDRNSKFMSEDERRAVAEYVADPDQVSEPANASLCGLLTAIADNFQSRRQAELLAQRLDRMRQTDDSDDDDLEVPDEDGKAPPADPGSLLDDLDL